jgi:hypothetical protein
MAFKNGINGHKAFKVTNKDILDLGRNKALNQLKSKNVINNKYRYVKYQGDFYSIAVSKAWSGAAPLVYLIAKVNILDIEIKTLNKISEFYRTATDMITGKPTFENNGFDRKTNQLLNEACSDVKFPFHYKEYAMTDVIDDYIMKLWFNAKNIAF